MSEKNIKNDYDYSRETYYDLLEKGKESLQLMIEVARESEHPRAFEVLSNMIKQTGDLTGELLDVQKKRKDITQGKDAMSNTTTNNAIFVGSTQELQKALRQTKKAIDVTTED